MRSLILISAVLALPVTAVATTRNVPSTYPTIQGAINASIDGDTVLVAPGTYAEKIDFLGKDITVTSSGGAAVTTIHPSVAGSAVSFKNGETINAVLSGFTITGGTGTVLSGTDSFGGGIFCSSSSPKITDNVIIANTARGDTIFNPGGSGGGIYANFSSPVISKNIIKSNQAQDAGAGIYCMSGSHPAIIENTITENILYSGSGGGIYATASLAILTNTIAKNLAWDQGGGIYCAADGTISYNTIVSNTTLGSGGGIRCGAASVTSNVITGNVANGFGPGTGGGIACSGSTSIYANQLSQNQAAYGAAVHCASGSATITDNVLVNNTAQFGGSPGYGGGLYCSSASPTVINNTIAFNTAVGGASGGIAASASTSIVNCIVWGNSAPSNPQLSGNAAVTYTDVQGGLAGTGNIDADPKFTNAALGDFHLLPVSPCLNAGSNAAPSLPLVDFEGDSRILHDVVDMGADEMAGCLVAFAPFGQGLAGSGGHVPALYGTDGSCDAGGHVVHISQGRGGATGNLWIGVSQADLPFYGGHFYVGFGGPWTTIPIKLNGPAGVPGAGYLDIPGANVNAYSGLAVFVQVSLLDVGAIHGVSLSNGCQIVIGQ